MVIEKTDLQKEKDNFLYNLRSQTSQLHTQLEQLPLSLKLTNKDLSVADYIKYLRLMQSIIIYTEDNIFPLIKLVVNDTDERKKSQLIKNDLEYLQVTPGKPGIFNLTTELVTDTSVALGFMYVIEGSTLGGRVIFKNVQSTLNLDEKNGASYFAGYQSKTGNMWKSFLDMLLSYQTKTKKENEIINGANIAFKSIYNLMH